MALLLEDGSYLQLESNSQPVGKLLLKGDPGAVFHTAAPPWRTASFGDGTTTVSWRSPLNPNERKTYTIDASMELGAINDQIQSVSVVMSGLAILAGLRIYGVTNDMTHVTVWFEVDPADRSRTGWNPPGETHLITVTITSIGGHVFQRDVSLVIVHL